MHMANIGDGFSLREATLADAEVIFRAIDNHRDYLSVWLPFVPQVTCIEDERRFLSATMAVPDDERNTVFIIEYGGACCGLIGLVNTQNANARTEIGYWLLPEFQHRGVMTRAVVILCQWLTTERNMNRIQIRCAVANAPSNAIPRRLGFTLEGVERAGERLASGHYTDSNVYSILKTEIDLWKRTY